jgi:hypothetical protein
MRIWKEDVCPEARPWGISGRGVRFEKPILNAWKKPMGEKPRRPALISATPWSEDPYSLEKPAGDS